MPLITPIPAPLAMPLNRLLLAHGISLIRFISSTKEILFLHPRGLAVSIRPCRASVRRAYLYSLFQITPITPCGLCLINDTSRAFRLLRRFRRRVHSGGIVQGGLGSEDGKPLRSKRHERRGMYYTTELQLGYNLATTRQQCEGEVLLLAICTVYTSLGGCISKIYGMCDEVISTRSI